MPLGGGRPALELQIFWAPASRNAPTASFSGAAPPSGGGGAQKGDATDCSRADSDGGAAVLILHPHPLLGGDMHNNVVTLLFDEFSRRAAAEPYHSAAAAAAAGGVVLLAEQRAALATAGVALSAGQQPPPGVVAVVRFNSRGVGASSHAATITCADEARDASALAQALLGGLLPPPAPSRVYIVGYSAGAAVGLSAAADIAAAAPPPDATALLPAGTAPGPLPAGPPGIRLPSPQPTTSRGSAGSPIGGYVAVSYPAGFLASLALGGHRRALRRLPRSLPRFLISGDADEFTGAPAFKALALEASEGVDAADVAVSVVPGGGHFWGGEERDLAVRVADWVAGREAALGQSRAPR